MAKGFSLIELMTVLAIIALLTAVGIPTYQGYMLRARMSEAKTYLDSYNQQIIDYYAGNGTFPTNTNLGVSSTVPGSAASYIHPPYVAYVSMSAATTTGTQCPYGVAIGYFSNYQGDYYSNGTSNYVVLSNYFIDVKGTMRQECMYYEMNPSTGIPTSNLIFPSCKQGQNLAGSSILSDINSLCS